MNIKIVFYSLLVFYLAMAQLSCDDSKKKSKTKDKPSQIYQTDNPSFNPQTGEFSVDKHTAALWHLNEGKDIVFTDSSPNNNYGQIVKGSWTDGRFGKAIKLSGRKQYLYVPDNQTLSLNKAVTVEMWVYIKRLVGSAMAILIKQTDFVDRQTYPNYGFYMKVKPGHSVFPVPGLWWWPTSTSADHYSLTAETSKKLGLSSLVGKWHYLAGTYNGEYSRLYIDGELISEVKFKGSLRTVGNGDLYIGTIHTNYLHVSYNGKVDEIRISNVARSPQAIKKYWDSVKDIKSNDTVTNDLEQIKKQKKKKKKNKKAKPN